MREIFEVRFSESWKVDLLGRKVQRHDLAEFKGVPSRESDPSLHGGMIFSRGSWIGVR